jgi:hypothetical protein
MASVSKEQKLKVRTKLKGEHLNPGKIKCVENCITTSFT